MSIRSAASAPRPTTRGGPPGSNLNSRRSGPTVMTRASSTISPGEGSLVTPPGARHRGEHATSGLEHLPVLALAGGVGRVLLGEPAGALLLVHLVGALAPDDLAVALERDDVGRDAVEEVAVVRD